MHPVHRSEHWGFQQIAYSCVSLLPHLSPLSIWRGYSLIPLAAESLARGQWYAAKDCDIAANCHVLSGTGETIARWHATPDAGG